MFHKSAPYTLRRVPRPHLTFFGRLARPYDCHRRNQSRTPDMGAAQHNASACYPRTRFDSDGSRNERHVAAVRVATSCQECLLGDHDIVTEIDVVLIVKPHAFADPRARPNMELPRKLYPSTRTEYDALADFRTEGFEDSHPQT
ncbi:hypothetical protein GCM10010459_07210 [Microbacterium schleiferi]